MTSKLITKEEIKSFGFDEKQTARIWRDVKAVLVKEGYTIYGQRTNQIPTDYVMRYLALSEE